MSIFPTTILLATDGSAEAQLAARTAADLAQRTDSDLHVLTVGAGVPISATTSPAHFEDVLRENRRQAQEVLKQEAKRIEESGATVNQTHLKEGRAEEEIVERAEELGAGLIVMGSRGHSRLRRALMGSVSDAVVRHAHCPVTIVGE
jgi:nucleotide-binding universal stress UspA family protein